MKRLPQVALILSAALLLGAEKAKVRPQNADDGKAVAGAEGSAAGAESREQKGRTDRQSEKTAGASTDSIERWIRQLDDRHLKAREEATQTLIDAGAPAVQPLLTAVEKKRGEVKHRATLIRSLDGGNLRFPSRTKSNVSIASPSHKSTVSQACHRKIGETCLRLPCAREDGGGKLHGRPGPKTGPRNRPCALTRRS